MTTKRVFSNRLQISAVRDGVSFIVTISDANDPTNRLDLDGMPGDSEMDAIDRVIEQIRQQTGHGVTVEKE